MKGLFLLYAAMVVMLADAPPLMAKGMEDLKPAPPVEAKPAPGAETPIPATNTAPINPPVPVDATATATTATTAVTPSATSRAIADRLSITAGLGVLSASASEGDWSARAGTELAAYYQLNALQTPNFALAAGLRYNAFDVTVENKMQSYRGVVEMYNLGVSGRFARASKMSYLAMGELGMAVVHLRSLERIEVDEKLNANGVNVSLGGGIDWRLQPKLFAGPRLMVGFGRLQTVQLSGNATFVF